MGVVPRRLAQAALAWFVGFCALPAWAGITVAGPQQRWTSTLRESWLPLCKQALDAYKLRLGSLLGERPSGISDVVLAADAAAAAAARAAAPDDVVILVAGATHRRAMQERTAIAMLEELMRRQLTTLSNGRAEQAPAWLNEGLARTVSYEIMQQVEGGLAPDYLRERVGTALRATKGLAAPAAILQATQAGGTADRQKGFRDLSVLMVEVLREQAGKDFDAKWVQYYRQLARAERAGSAPDIAFGMSGDELAARTDARLKAILAEVRQHAEPLPEPSGYAAIDAIDRLPRQSDSVRRGYRNFLEARAPKAFAMNPGGGFAYVADNPSAMALALSNCSDMEAVGCELYAVDERVVYRKRDWQPSDITLHMVNGEDGDWRRQVARVWLPVVERSARAFNEHIRQELKGGLEQPVEFYLTATLDDFANTLAGPMRLTQDGASEFSKSAGVSNERGQVIIRILDTSSEDFKKQVAVKSTLHELTHELQAQLAKRYAGFRPAPWILEGSADLFAFTIASRLDIPEARDFSYAKWRENCVTRYKAPLTFTASVDELLQGKGKDWLQLMRFNKGNYQVAGLMMVYLQETLGERFNAAWMEYFRLAGEKGQTEPQAFERSFGMTREAYASGVKAWLAKL